MKLSILRVAHMRERNANMAGARREHRRLEMATASAMGDAQRPAQEHVPVNARDQLHPLTGNEMRDGSADHDRALGHGDLVAMHREQTRHRQLYRGCGDGCARCQGARWRTGSAQRQQTRAPVPVVWQCSASCSDS